MNSAIMFMCDTCGPLDHVLLDAPVEARVLEGVLFEVRQVNGNYIARPRQEDIPYVATLNAPMWCKSMAHYAAEAVFARCPKCGADVDMENEK